MMIGTYGYSTLMVMKAPHNISLLRMSFIPSHILDFRMNYWVPCFSDVIKIWMAASLYQEGQLGVMTLTLPLSTEVPVPRQESEKSYISVLGVSSFPLFLWFFYYILELFRQYGVLCFCDFSIIFWNCSDNTVCFVFFILLHEYAPMLISFILEKDNNNLL
jgi:hypothetical protein